MIDWEDEVATLFPDVVPWEELTDPAAKATARLLTSGMYGGGRLLACRTRESQTRSRMGLALLVLVVELDIEIGQRQVVNDIRQVERLALVFVSRELIPFVCPLRGDFPNDVPHLNLSLFGEPRSLCLFEMPHEEVLRIATPFVLLERVRLWMRETAYGRLHGDEQPMEPLFSKSRGAVVLPDADGVVGLSGLYCGVRASDRPGFPVFLRTWNADEARRAGNLGFPVLMLVTPALVHGRIQAIPANMAELLACFAELRVDLLGLLRAGIRVWVADGRAVVPMGQSCLVVVRTPIMRSEGMTGRDATKAFMTECTADILAEKLGALLKVDEQYAVPLVTTDVVEADLRALRLAAMDVHHGTVGISVCGLA